MADRMDSHGPLVEAVRALARAVRARRKKLGLTQIALSQLAGSGPDFIYDVELGKPTLRLDKLLELLDVLGLELVLSEGRDILRVAPSLATPEPSTKSRQAKKKPPA